jgi:hypothetical protein
LISNLAQILLIFNTIPEFNDPIGAEIFFLPHPIISTQSMAGIWIVQAPIFIHLVPFTNQGKGFAHVFAPVSGLLPISRSILTNSFPRLPTSGGESEIT